MILRLILTVIIFLVILGLGSWKIITDAWFIFGTIVAIIYALGIMVPRINNWLFIGMWIAWFGLLGNAFYQGGGEPLGLRAMEKIAQPPAVTSYSQEDLDYLKATRFIYDKKGRQITVPPPSMPTKPIPEGDTWFWWKIFGWWTAFSVLFIFVAFWDELKEALHRIREQWEQRTVHISLRPPAPLSAAASGASQVAAAMHAAGFWGRFKEMFTAAISADMVQNIVFDWIRQVGRSIMGRRKP
jgi:hypothetical protein